MVFTDLFFIFCFLPLAVCIYNILPNDRLKNIILLIFSLLFYSWSNPVSLLLLLLSILWNYFTGLELKNEDNLRNRKIILVAAVIVNVLILGFFKYSNFFLSLFHVQYHLNVMLPVGLSFFTFSELSYLFDVYNNKTEAQKNIVLYALYVSFFGKISMGPIVQYHQIENQLKERKVTKENFSAGVTLFIKGLVKKVLLADQLASLFSMLQSNQSVLGTWLYAIAYMLQIYFDFSGYSDMAIGLSKFFGFEFEPNFDHPYAAVNVQDFWRRWHISLSRWFRDYLYIPLGGSRVSQKLYIRNILIVWLCTGFWHGANWTFIVWGLYYGCFLLIEKYWLRAILNKLPGFISRIYLLLVVLIGWVFFMSPDIQTAFMVLGRMIGIHVSGVADNQALFILTTNLALWILSILFSTKLYDRIQIVFYNTVKQKAVTITYVVYIVMFILCIAFIVGNTYHSFLYFAF